MLKLLEVNHAANIWSLGASSQEDHEDHLRVEREEFEPIGVSEQRAPARFGCLGTKLCHHRRLKQDEFCFGEAT